MKGLLQRILGAHIVLFQLRTFANAGQNGFYVKLLGLEDGIGRADGIRMVGVTSGSHGKLALEGVFIGLAVIAFESGGCIEDFETVDLEGIQNRASDSRAK